MSMQMAVSAAPAATAFVAMKAKAMAGVRRFQPRRALQARGAWFTPTPHDRACGCMTINAALARARVAPAEVEGGG